MRHTDGYAGRTPPATEEMKDEEEEEGGEKEEEGKEEEEEEEMMMVMMKNVTIATEVRRILNVMFGESRTQALAN